MSHFDCIIYEVFQFKYYMRLKEIHTIKTVILLDLWSFLKKQTFKSN